jgi:predicted NAD-dependent protein-ADP-ribosyltransferase YbiA (DUF1768 family)
MFDEATTKKILAAPGPAETKALGRQVSSFDQELLERDCDAIAEGGDFLKFSQDERPKETLPGTRNREIMETSPNDRF